MRNVVILQRVEYEEIVSRLHRISNLQKQLLFALEMRNPRPFPSTTRPEAQYEEIVRGLDQISNLQKQLLVALKSHSPRSFPSTTKPENEKK